jgi:uncharacterized lipoprotein YmbA
MNALQKHLIQGFKLTVPIGCCVLVCGALTGCRIFKPVQDQTRFYVLSNITASPSAVHSNQNLTIGIVPVEIPAYLQNSRIAVRRGTNEIDYSADRQWAEHLDKGIQRVLALDLSNLLPGSRMITSAWQRDDVRAEVHITIQRFELDEKGEATLECQWRIISPDQGHAIQSGHVSITRKGPPLANNPTSAVQSLSEALADMSEKIAKALPTL